MKLDIDTNWTFKDIVNNIEALRSQYRDIIASFSYKQLNDEVIFKRTTRTIIYSYNFDEWKKDRIWEVLNNDFDAEELKKISLYTN